MDECVVCGSTEKLDTELNILIDNTNHSVRVCESCGEDIPLKKIKEIYNRKLRDDDKKQERIKILLAELGELGYELQSKPIHSNEQEPPIKEPNETRSLKVKDGRSAIRKTPSIPHNIPKAANGVNLPSYDSYNIEETVATKDGSEYRAPQDEHTETQVVNIMGVPQRIPRTVEGESGKTSIRIIQTNDEEIQRLVRSNKDGSHSFGASGFTVTDCTFCSGTGEARVGHQACPRCKGRGLS